MPLPADRLRQLRAIILKSERSQSLVKNRVWKPYQPTERRIGFDWQGSWTAARKNVADRLRAMRKTGRPDVQLHIGLPYRTARGRLNYAFTTTYGPSLPGEFEKTRKKYMIRTLPLSRPERDRMLLAEASRQYHVRFARRELYRHLKKMRQQ